MVVWWCCCVCVCVRCVRGVVVVVVGRVDETTRRGEDTKKEIMEEPMLLLNPTLPMYLVFLEWIFHKTTLFE